MLGLVAEAEQRDLGAALGYRNTVAWLGSALRLSTREAKQRVDHAKALMAGTTMTGDAQERELRETGEALARGEISREHVAEIQRVFAHCPKGIDTESRAQTQSTLLELARQAKPEALRAVGRRVLHYWDVEKPPKDKEKPQRCREFHYSYDSDGWMRFTGTTDPETAATLEGQFSGLAKPRGKNLDGTPDQRSAAERHGDALAEIIALAARAEEASVQGGERAVLFLTLTVEEMEQRLRDAVLDIPGLRDIGDIRRLACEAGVIPAVFSAEGEPLYLGRQVRLATPGQRRALALRDSGCTALGCTRSPKWTRAHHWWSRNGNTNLDELALACGEHHRLLHNSDWEIRITNNIAWWIPPKWLDPQQTPLRNTAHDLGPPQHHIDTS
jgi:Domain of unknown function (DUF222)